MIKYARALYICAAHNQRIIITFIYVLIYTYIYMHVQYAQVNICCCCYYYCRKKLLLLPIWFLIQEYLCNNITLFVFIYTDIYMYIKYVYTYTCRTILTLSLSHTHAHTHIYIYIYIYIYTNEEQHRLQVFLESIAKKKRKFAFERIRFYSLLKLSTDSQLILNINKPSPPPRLKC